MTSPTSSTSPTSLVVLWLVWGFASLLAYWGARKAAVRTPLVYGTFWLVFMVLSKPRRCDGPAHAEPARGAAVRAGLVGGSLAAVHRGRAPAARGGVTEDNPAVLW